MFEKNRQPSNTAELNDDQLDNVAGGFETVELEYAEGEESKYCECCGRMTVHFYGVLSVYCSVCGHELNN